jgi:hypothetical protein
LPGRELTPGSRLAAGLLLAVGSILCAVPVDARLVVSSGIDYLGLREETEPIEVREGGALFTLALRHAPRPGQPVQWIYDGKLVLGWVGYEGAYLEDPATPATSTTEYVGTTQEVQARFSGTSRFDGVVGLAGSVWRRSLGSSQNEDFWMLAIRIGLDRDAAEPKAWGGGFGIRIPVWLRENAHFDEMGFALNPDLEPGKRIGGFARVAYRLDDTWSVAGQGDVQSFDRSDDVLLDDTGGVLVYAHQPALRMVTVGVRLEYRFK